MMKRICYWLFIFFLMGASQSVLSVAPTQLQACGWNYVPRTNGNRTLIVHWQNFALPGTCELQQPTVNRGINPGNYSFRCTITKSPVTTVCRTSTTNLTVSSAIQTCLSAGLIGGIPCLIYTTCVNPSDCEGVSNQTPTCTQVTYNKTYTQLWNTPIQFYFITQATAAAGKVDPTPIINCNFVDNNPTTPSIPLTPATVTPVATTTAEEVTPEPELEPLEPDNGDNGQ